jgi:hypothetical protein
MTTWQYGQATFRFQLSDWVFFTASLPMQIRADSLLDATPAVKTPTPPAEIRLSGSEGFSIRNLPVECEQPTLSSGGEYLCYIPLQYLHCYIDLSWSFDQYASKFSSKTRSTIQRKIRKYKEHCGGSINWKSYRQTEELPDFFHHARQVSKLTYQERLLDVGLPDSEEFRQNAMHLAQNDRLRAYILFDGNKPVSYLFCPEKDGVLVYAYLGYDPEYLSLSVGTVLQWLAIEQIFQERKFQYFDFTEGQSSHKQLFGSHQRLCANVFFVRKSITNTLLIRAHWFTNIFSKWLGDTLDRYGVKTKVKKMLRRA